MPQIKFVILLIAAAESFILVALSQLRHTGKSAILLGSALIALAAAIILIVVETLYYTGG